MKHTPGPWKLYYEVFRPQLSRMKIIEVQDSKNKAIVRWTGFESADQPKKEKLANARLIAAAPELLEALQLIVENASKVPTYNDEYFLHQIALDQAKVAIAKAEGK